MINNYDILESSLQLDLASKNTEIKTDLILIENLNESNDSDKYHYIFPRIKINKYFEMKLATVFRDKEENFIPKNSTINRKTSNLFGSVTSKMSDNLELNYNFSIDNDYNKFEYNDFNATFSVNNIITKFNFIEENGEMGDANAIESKLSYQFDDENFLSLKTRRNRKINLTEYYDLVYEYKNDCLTAGIKYKKTYYNDNDLKPTENLLFTISLFPLTTYEYNANDLMDQ